MTALVPSRSLVPVPESDAVDRGSVPATLAVSAGAAAEAADAGRVLRVAGVRRLGAGVDEVDGEGGCPGVIFFFAMILERPFYTAVLPPCDRLLITTRATAFEGAESR